MEIWSLRSQATSQHKHTSSQARCAKQDLLTDLNTAVGLVSLFKIASALTSPAKASTPAHALHPFLPEQNTIESKSPRKEEQQRRYIQVVLSGHQSKHARVAIKVECKGGLWSQGQSGSLVEGEVRVVCRGIDRGYGVSIERERRSWVEAETIRRQRQGRKEC